MLPKTWCAIHRRSDNGPPLHQCWDTVLRCLSDETACDNIPGLVIPETVIFLVQSTHWYYYDEDAKCILRKPPTGITTDAMRRAMTYRNEISQNGDVCAVFWSERQDSHGTLVTMECLDSEGLTALLELKPNRGKLGVLLQFIPPAQAQSLYQFVVSMTNGAPASVERHVCRNKYHDIVSEPSKCPRVMCFEAIPALGKLVTATAPHPPSDIVTSHDEIHNPAFHTHFNHIMQCLGKQLTTSFAPGSTLEKLVIITQLDPLTHGLVLIGVAALSLRAPRKEFIFEFLAPAHKVRKHTHHGVDDPTLTDDYAPKFDLSEPVDFDGMEPIPEVFHSSRPRTAPHREVKSTLPSATLLEEMGWCCPNCNTEATQRVTLCLEDVVNFYDACVAKQVHDLKVAMTRVKQGHRRMDLAPDMTPIPLLERMNIPLHEIRSRRVWRQKLVYVCSMCANTFLQGRPSVAVVPSSSRPTSASLGSPPRHQPSIAEDDFSLRNRMVFTTYQGVHREQEERDHLVAEFQTMKSEYERHQNKMAHIPTHDDLFEKALVESTQPENALDVPYCVVLMNELHQFASMMAPGAIPPPPVTVSLGKSLDDIKVREERLKSSGVHKCREEVLKVLGKGSSIVNFLSKDEISLLFGVVDV